MNGGSAFVVSFIFGLIHVRHRSLPGVSITHYVGGMTAMALGFL